MSSNTIIVEQPSKTYQVPEREAGFGAAVRSFFKRKYKDVKAVQNVNFNIAQGETVGFFGPNQILLFIIVSIVSFLIASKVWKWRLNRYSGASS